jgi:hypothetical protein
VHDDVALHVDRELSRGPIRDLTFEIEVCALSLRRATR